MSTHVVILGAGFGGLELSSRLSAELADEVRVTLIDQGDSFIFGFSKLDVMFGRRTMDEVRIPYRDITRPGVTFRQESVLSIDPGRKRVVTNAGGYDADVLVVALGADLAPEATPGLDECGHEFYSPSGAARVRDHLPAFPGGNVVIAVLGGFFECPPAPYETAVMLHDYLARRGVRDATAIHLVTPMSKPIPISDETSDALTGLLDERGIRHSHASWIDEMGEDTVGTVDANFLSGPAPTALFTPPSLEGSEDNRRFAAFRRDRWFGPGSGASRPDGTTPDAPSPDEESHDHNPA